MATIVLVGLRGWSILLLAFGFGLVICTSNGAFNATNLLRETKGEKRSTVQLKTLTINATGRTAAEVDNLFNDIYYFRGYGCWCGPAGHGKIVDNFDLCCKIHDQCRQATYDKYRKGGLAVYCLGEHWYLITAPTSKTGDYTCDEVNKYPGTTRFPKCNHATCVCDLEFTKCIREYQNKLNSTNIGYEKNHQCSNTGGAYCKKKADVAIFVQDSNTISTNTVAKMKALAVSLVQSLESKKVNYMFSFGIYATIRRISRFMSSSHIVKFITRYRHQWRGPNSFTKCALKLLKRHFARRPDNRKDDDTAKIVVLLTDGKSEVIPSNDCGLPRHNGKRELMKIFELEKTAKRLRDDGIKLIGALIPNNQGSQRPHELKSIVSEPNDAVIENFSITCPEDIAKQVAFRAGRWVCPALYKVVIHTSDTDATDRFVLHIKVEGKNGEITTSQILRRPHKKDVAAGKLKYQFAEGNVGDIGKVWIRSFIRNSSHPSTWILTKVRVTKGCEVVTAAFGTTFDVSSGESWEKRDAVANRKNCYTFHDESTTWENATKNCEKLGTHLLTIETDEEWKEVVNSMKLKMKQSTTCSRWYVGLRKQDNVWRWTGDGIPSLEVASDDKRWRTGQPSTDTIPENCGEISSFRTGRKLKIDNIHCSKIYSRKHSCGYICENN